MLAIIFGIIVGLSLGLTGGGGSIFAVPLLIYGLGIKTGDATIISLATVAIMAAVGAAGALRAGLVELRVAFLFIAGGMLAAPAGIKLNQQVDEVFIINGFAILMCCVALYMWYKASRSPESSRVVRSDFVDGSNSEKFAICQFSDHEEFKLSAPCSVVLTISGIVSGIASGFFGVGGGFIIVPILIFVTRMSIHRAVATSLVVITMIGLSGTVSVLLSNKELPWLLSGLFLVGGIAGMISGRLLAKKIAGPLLQKCFAVAMVVIAIIIFTTR